MARGGRRVPRDREAEVWVIGSVLLRPAVLDEIGWLSADDFFEEDLRKCYAAMKEMRASGKAIDTGLVRMSLGGGSGWAAKIAEICGKVPVAAHASTYADVVRHTALQRSVMTALESGLTDTVSCGYGTPILPRIEAVERELKRIRRQEWERGVTRMMEESTMADYTPKPGTFRMFAKSPEEKAKMEAAGKKPLDFSGNGCTPDGRVFDLMGWAGTTTTGGRQLGGFIKFKEDASQDTQEATQEGFAF